MSVFDFPRLRVTGMTRINVGTANNDDYASSIPKSDANYFYPDAEEKTYLRTFDSNEVRLENHLNMSPAEYISWLNKAHTFTDEKSGKPKREVPGYWNYYGSMGMWTDGVQVKGVTIGPGQEITDSHSTSDPFIQSVLGGEFSFFRALPDGFPPVDPNNKQQADHYSTAVMTDIKSEGSSPGSQIFADSMMLTDKDGKKVFYRSTGASGNYDTGGRPTKATSCWLASQGFESFYAGFFHEGEVMSPVLNPAAAAYFQSVMPFEPGFADEGGLGAFFARYADPDRGEIKGIVVRYIMYLGVHFGWTTEDYEKNYAQPDFYKRLNERYCPITAVLTPWYGEDANAATPDWASMPLGREIQPIPDLFVKTPGFPAPQIPVTLSPIIARLQTYRAQPVLSLEVGKALTSYFTDVAGKLWLYVGKSAQDAAPILLGELPYGNPVNQRNLKPGTEWQVVDNPNTTLYVPPQQNIIDFSLTTQQAVILQGHHRDYPDGGTLLVRTDNDRVFVGGAAAKPVTQFMVESTYSIGHNQRTVYAEQAIGTQPCTQDTFIYDGPEPVESRFHILRKGKIVTSLPTDETFYLLGFRTTPLPMAYANTPFLSKEITSLDDLKLQVDVAQPGSVRFVVVTSAQKDQFKQFKDLDASPIPVAQVRILPNEDYSAYYVDPTVPYPVGNEKLTFQAVYEHIFKPYHVLYPAMDHVKSMQNKMDWSDPYTAQLLWDRIAADNFSNHTYMPRTRDLSASRRQFLQAFCLKINPDLDKGDGNTSLA